MLKQIEELKEAIAGLGKKDLAVTMSRRDYMALHFCANMQEKPNRVFLDNNDKEITITEAAILRADTLIAELDKNTGVSE